MADLKQQFITAMGACATIVNRNRMEKKMIRTGKQYKDNLKQNNRNIWIDGEKVTDITEHPHTKSVVNIKARMYDLQHEQATKDIMSYAENGERFSIALKMPKSKQDWHDKYKATDTLLNDVNGVVTRVGDENIGEIWSLFDGRETLNEINPQFSQNIENHINRIVQQDPFHISANTDPKGDRSLAPQDKDPDMLLHAIKETDAGIIVRGAKYETAAAYGDEAFTKPTIANWGNDAYSDYAVGFVCDLNSSGLTFLGRTGFAGRSKNPRDYPLSNKFDEVDFLVVFDNVLIPWENVLFYRDTKSAAFIRNTLHRYSAFAFVQRNIKLADMMIGTALWNAKQTGLEHQQAVQEKLAKLACYREGVYAHLIAAIEMSEKSPGGLVMPNQSLLYTGRVLACSQLYQMMQITRELCGGQTCVTPDVSTFEHPKTKPWLDKFYTVNDNWVAEDRRKLLALARDMVNSDYAGHRLTFQLFAQSPPFAHLAAVYRNFDWEGPLDLVKNVAGLSDNVLAKNAL